MAKETKSGQNGNGHAGATKAPMFTVDEPVSPEQIQNALLLFEKIKNGAFADAVGFGAGSGFPFNQGVPGTAPVEQANTLFKNLRYYLVSNFRQLLNQCYVEIGLIQTIVDVPVDDGLRGGVTIKSKQLDENQIEELQTSMDRDDDINTAGQAGKWNRLFGGAGLIIITDQDPMAELNVKAITKDTPLQFKAVDMWELFWDQQNVEGGLNLEGEQLDFEFYSYYAQNVHKTRVMPLKGMTAPSFIRPRLRGWGFSVVEALVRSINQYLKATELGFEVLDEFKLDVYKIKNLVNTLISPNGAQKVKERIALANWQKNYQNAVVMDKEDEFDHKQLSFAGLGDAMDGIRMQVAADMRMPRSKLFGESGGGLNSGNNEGDLKVYNSMVEGQVRNKLKYPIIRMIEIKCQKLFGFIPDDIKIEFKPLEVMNAEQEENVKNAKFNRLLSAKSAGEITTFEFREGCNRDNLLSISLDTAGDSLNPDDPEVQSLVDGTDAANDAAIEGNGEEDAEEGNEGADKPDAERPQLNKKDKVKNDGWDEGKHPRKDDGKFGKGSGKSKKSKGTTTETPADVEVIPEDIFEPNLTEEQEATARARFRTPDDRKNPATETPKETSDRQHAQEKAMRERATEPKKITLAEAKSKGVRWAYHAAEGDVVEVKIQPSESEPPKLMVASVDRVVLSERANGDPNQVEYHLKTGDEEGGRYAGTWVCGKGSPWVQIKEVMAKAKTKNEIRNSIDYEMAAYAVDTAGRQHAIEPGREPFLDRLSKDPLWIQAMSYAREAFGRENKDFAYWWYLRQGGKRI